MAFHTFKHPDFASKYRNYLIVTEDQPLSPHQEFNTNQTFETELSLRLMVKMSDDVWKVAKKRLAETGYFVMHLGALAPSLPQ